METSEQINPAVITPTTDLMKQPLQNKRRFWDTKTTIRLALIIVILGILSFGTVLYVARGAQPGEPLYTIKTTLTEPAFTLTKLSPTSRISYTTYLLERRIAELTTLAGDTGTSSPELLATVSSLIETHTTDIVDTIENNPNLDGVTKINFLAKADTVTRAAETLSDTTPELTTITDTLTSAENHVGDALTESIASFVTTNATDTIQSFITTQITAVGTEVVTTAPGSKAQSLVIRRISDAQESIADSKWVDAITYLLRARQAIAVDGYLFSAERGPVDGIEIEAVPVPEGN